MRKVSIEIISTIVLILTLILEPIWDRKKYFDKKMELRFYNYFKQIVLYLVEAKYYLSAERYAIQTISKEGGVKKHNNYKNRLFVSKKIAQAISHIEKYTLSYTILFFIM